MSNISWVFEAVDAYKKVFYEAITDRIAPNAHYSRNFNKYKNDPHVILFYWHKINVCYVDNISSLTYNSLLNGILPSYRRILINLWVKKVSHEEYAWSQNDFYNNDKKIYDEICKQQTFQNK